MKVYYLFKGRTFFKQYIPSKGYHFGIKLSCFVTETGYVLNFIIYTRAFTQIQEDPDDPNVRKLGIIILTLMNPYMNRDHCLYYE